MVRIFYILVFLLLGKVCISQIPNTPKNIPSPNAASLGVYGEVPVSHFTGLPNITIPIFEFTDKNIQIPISLSYHASGLRPDQHPGWVGLGWNLFAGGSITRTVKDLPDDMPNSTIIQTEDGQTGGYYVTFNNLNNSDWNNRNYVLQGAQNNGDSEPDEFSFTFPGGSGKFYLDHNRNWIVKCDKAVKVELTGLFMDVPHTIVAPFRTFTNMPSFPGFQITDEWGNKYIFGNDASSVEYSIDFFRQKADEWIAESWLLKKIISANGYEVSFEYERGNFVCQMFMSLYMNLSSSIGSCSSSEISSLDRAYKGRLISPVYLKKITSENLQVELKSSESTELKYDYLRIIEYEYENWRVRNGLVNGGFISGIEKFLPALAKNQTCLSCFADLKWRKLDRIEISSILSGTTPVLKKAYNLTYNNVSSERLMLKEVEEIGTGEEEKNPYKFSYDESMPLPGYLDNKNDHWGYYNGNFAGVDAASRLIYYSLREPNSDYLYAGTLKKIEYPTGGTTEFIYEPHQYSKRLMIDRSEGIDPSFNTKTIAGGLRIKKIISSPIPNGSEKREKEYFYVRNYSNESDVASLPSSGVLGGRTKYSFDDYTSYIVYTNGSSNTVNYTVFSTQSVLPASINSQGCHVGYTEVVEKESDGGYTIYTYSNFDNGVLDEPGEGRIQVDKSEYEPVSSRADDRGMLLRQRVFNSANVLLVDKNVEYFPLNKSTEYARAIRTRRLQPCQIETLYAYEGNAYKNYCYSYLPISETTISYDQGGLNPSTLSTVFSYISGSKLLRNMTVYDGLKLKRTEYKYPADYVLAGSVSEPLASGIKKLKDMHVYAQPIEVLNQIKTSSDVDFRTVSGILNTFKPNSIWADKVLKIDNIYQAPAFQPSTSTSNSFSFDFRYREDIILDSYDEYGNVTEMHKPGGPTTVLLWGYFGQQLVASLTGPNISYQSVSANVNLNTLKSASAYDPLLLKSHLNILYSIPDVFVKTYSYWPLFGLASETNELNRTVYYYYDGLGRLQLIKNNEGEVVKRLKYNYKN